MSEILNSLLVPLGILVLLGALFLTVQVVAAVRVGEAAAMSRLRRWRNLPEAVLRLSAAPNIEAAVQGMTGALAEGVGARGRLALIRVPGEGFESAELHVAASGGTLQGRADQEMLAATLAVGEFAALATGEGERDLLQLPAGRMPKAFHKVFPQARRGRMLAVRLRMKRGGERGPTAGLIILHVPRVKRLDRFNMEAVEAAVQHFPRVVEAVTVRFAQAELMEQLLEEARVKDGLLKMLLGSFQHDLGNTLGSLEAVLLRAWETTASSDRPGKASEADLAELYRTIQLVATVARSGDSLVDMAEGRSPLVTVESHRPGELFEQVVRPFLSLRARRRPDLVLETEIPEDLPHIQADRVAFFRVLSNVLHNAFKYTQEGAVRVRAYLEGDQVIFAVSDTGPGMPAEELPRIGSYRFRAGRSAGVKGEGIGLWVTRRLLEAMGGTLRVESEVGVGSTFYLGFATSPALLDPGQVQVRAD